VPDDLDALLALPGIGAYTARAVLAFAFERPVGIVDVNAARVHARLRGHALSSKQVQAAADEATPPSQPWAWNQAVLDLGATVCTKHEPACARCPLSTDCGWRRVGNLGPDPVGIVKQQSRFEGSDRQGRGRLVSALRHGPVSSEPIQLAKTMGWPDDPGRSLRVATTVVADGLAEWEHQSGILRLQ
jgi:A/G-specific adenine glycosylase